MQTIDITRGNDIYLNDRLIYRGETFDPALCVNLEAHLVSRAGARTQLSVTIIDNYLRIFIPWITGRMPGLYGLEVRGVTNGLRWATYADSLIRYTNETVQGNDDDITVASDAYDISQQVSYRYGESPIAEINISCDNAVGTPSVEASYINRILQMAFHNIKGNGIASVTKTESSEQDGGTNTWRITFDNGTYTDISVKNGATGNGIASVTKTESSEQDGGTNTWRITLGDGTYTDISLKNGAKGNGVASVVKTESSDQDGGTNTWRITFDNGEYADISVKNGTKGPQGDSVLVEQGDLPLAHVTGNDNKKAMSQKGVTDIVEVETVETLTLVKGENSKYLKNDQTTGSYGDMSYSDYFEIPALTTKQKMVFSDLFQNSSSSSIYFYDEQKTLLPDASIDVSGEYTLMPDEIPSNARYIRVNFVKANYASQRYRIKLYTREGRLDRIEAILAERKLYGNTGQNIDGSMTQKAITETFDGYSQIIQKNYIEGKRHTNSEIVDDETCFIPNGMIDLPVATVGTRNVKIKGLKTGVYVYFVNENGDITNVMVGSGSSELWSSNAPEDTVKMYCTFLESYKETAYVVYNQKYIWRPTDAVGVTDLNKERLELENEIENDFLGIPNYYQSYIQNKAYKVFNKDVLYKGNGDSFIFLTDYHLPDYGTVGSTCTQFRHSGALVRFIQRHTESKRFVFGGDTVCSPETDSQRLTRMEWFIGDFRDTNILPVIGNHEWRNSDAVASNKELRNRYDFANFMTNLKDVVFDEYNIPYYYFDNPQMKIRYFVMYAPETNDANATKLYFASRQLPFLQAKALEVGAAWNIVIFQHVTGTSGSTNFDENGEPLNMSYVDTIGKQLIDALNSYAQNPNFPRILGVITGHTHFDWVQYEASFPIIVTTCDASYHWMFNSSKNEWQNSSYPLNNIRKEGTVNEQAFDVMHIDLEGNKWDLTRIGYGRDRIIRLTTINVSVGGTAAVTPNIALAQNGGNFDWQTRNNSVATVNNGVVTGVAAGMTVLKIANDANYDNQTAWEYVNIVVS